MQARIIVFVSAIAVISLAVGISIESAISQERTTTLIQTTIETVTIGSPNSNLTTMTVNCAEEFPICGISANYYFADSTTTVIIFEYPSANTTSYYTLKQTHQTS
jgi:hypothetical protein